MEATAFRFADGRWMPPAGGIAVTPEANAMHALLVERADRLIGCAEVSGEEGERGNRGR